MELISNSKQILLVCNTHLISNPDGDNIRLFQTLIELTIINKIKKNISNNVSMVKNNISVYNVYLYKLICIV